MSGNVCLHCGADCGKSPFNFNQQLFCCSGCKQVFQLLNENKLYQYYSIEATPGIKIQEQGYESKYAFLDKEEVRQKIYEFYESDTARVTFYVPSIHCASCIWLLEHLNRLNSGIQQSFVNFVRKELTISFDPSIISVRQVVELLASIHYIPDISLKTLDKKDIQAIDRKLMYKIGVAGFIFGNVMLYSLPEYFNGKPLGDSLGNFLYYLGFVLIIPLVFYSGSDYIVSAWKNLRKGLINIDLPIALGILALFFVTGFEVLTLRGPGYSDTLSGFLFFLLLGKWYQGKTYQSLSFDRDYKSYFPIAVTKIEDGIHQSKLLEEIVVGDTLLIRSKELIPADSILIEGNALIDYSFVTGESIPIRKMPGDLIYAGGTQTGGAITIKVEREVKQSHLTQLWNQKENRQESHRSLTSLTDSVSVYFTVIIIAIAILGFGFWLAKGDFHAAILVLTSVLIVACPCALAMSLPFTLGTAMRILGTKGMYLKNIRVIEKLARIDTIVFDKTGTLTKPEENNVEFIGNPLTDLQIQAIKSIIRQSTHPLSQALDRYMDGVQPLATQGYVEMSGKGIFSVVDGSAIKLGSLEFAGENADQQINSDSKIYVSINEQYKGFYRISNQYRPGFDVVIRQLNQQFDLYLLSGDNDAEKEYLESHFGVNKIFFNQLPKNKMEFINSLREQGRNVMMMGDGLNDAGAFMQSDVALSIADDIYHFSPAGDAIVEATQFYRLPDFIRFARKSINVVKMSFAISFFYNVIGLIIALTGHLSPVVAAVLMPISSITVVAFATFATRILARRVLKLTENK
ncbi:MAG: heavy metal translocating P-type ATPase metal-binding domain-containing protein [Mariniphaga sp.]